jgi:hypothetical protein
MLCVSPLVVSVTVMSVNTTVIGGLQLGWNVAVAESVKSAFPFCTGKSPAAETLEFGNPLRVELAVSAGELGVYVLEHEGDRCL